MHHYRTYILSVLLYGCETWTVTKTLAKRLDANSTPDVCVKFYEYHTPGILHKWDRLEHQRLFASLWKGKMLSAEVLLAPGSVSPGGRPSPCRLRRNATDIWLEVTRGASKNHLAENDRRWRSALELWSPHGVEDGKGQGGLSTSRQYGNALEYATKKKKIITLFVNRTYDFLLLAHCVYVSILYRSWNINTWRRMTLNNASNVLKK